MMKYKKIHVVLLITTIFTFTSCEKYLSVNPDQRASLDKPETISELLVNAYPKANYVPFCEAMSDNAIENIQANVNMSNLQAYTWREVESTGQDTPISYWNQCYKAIAAANQAIKTISEVNNPSAYRAQLGEALVARAYAHFMLVALWSKTYNETTSSTDLGIPYVLEPENVVHKQYERKTVAYVYQQIEKDLIQGLPLISDDSYKKPTFHFNKKAAYAFASRYYLFKKDYAKVVQYADMAFPGNSIIGYIRDWNAYSLMTVSNRTQTYSRPTEKSNLLLAEAISAWAGTANTTVGYGSALGNRFQSNIGVIYPFTLKSYGNLANADLAYVVLTGINNHAYISKHARFFISPLNSNLGNYYVYATLISTEEVLFNKAEALAMLDRPDEAIVLLNTFLSKRIKGTYNPSVHNLDQTRVLSHYPGTDIKTAVVNAVLDFKRIDYMHEGMRWFDILRKGIRIEHPVADKGITGEFNTVLGPQDPRRQLQLPPTTVLAGLEPNQR